MKMTTSGRDQFSKYKSIILIIIKLFSLLGKKNNYRLLNICRNLGLKKSFTFKERFKNAFHYVFISLILKKLSLLRKSSKVFFIVFAFQFGITLYFNLKLKR